MLVQAVAHPSRVHIDIETDDTEAEVRPLQALGARRVEQVERWWVMESPTGQRLCVVRLQRSDFAEGANSWAAPPDRRAAVLSFNAATIAPCYLAQP